MSTDIVNAIDSSSLDIFVPEDSTFDLENFLRFNTENEIEGHSKRSLSTVAQRDVLHFDESIAIYLVLRTDHTEKAHLLSFVQCLVLVLEVLAYSTHPKSEYGRHTPHHPTQSPHQDIIWSGPIDKSQKPTIRLRDGHQIEAIWRVPVVLSRPRVRLLSPSISFRPSATLSRSFKVGSSASEDRYLPSGVPTSVNLLESLKHELALKGIVPRLPARRLTRINTANSDPPLAERALSVLSQRDFRAVPAITARVRYSKANPVSGKPTVVASLDIETATFLKYDMCIEAVQLKVSEGSTENLNQSSEPLLPMICRPKDNATFLFRLILGGPCSEANNPNSNSRMLDISIDATVFASQTCKPCIQMRWRTAVDFSTSLNPTYGAPSQPLQRSKRPANISMAQVTSNEIGTPGPGQSLDTDDGRRRERAISISDLGVSVIFTAPKEIYVGVPFCWDLFVVNRSSKPRKLVIAVIPKRKEGDARAHLSRPIPSSTGEQNDSGTADAVIDEHILYAMQRNASIDAVQIVSLSSELKIGPLVAGSCFNGELKFLPLAKGVLEIEAVRINDAITNESIDVRDLPDIIAGERGRNE